MGNTHLDDDRPCPNFLYRFRSAETDYFVSELRALVDRQEQYFSSIETLNDPFDCNPVIGGGNDKDFLDLFRKVGRKYIISEATLKEKYPNKSNKEIKAWLKRDFRANPANVHKARQSLRSILEEYRATTKAICLTESWESPLHWAHYASGHNGIALKFAVEVDVADATNDDLPFNIIYSRERPKITETDIQCWLEGLSEKDYPEFSVAADMAYISMNFSKSDVWSYEREWRIQKRFKGPASYRYVPALKLSEVILGTRFSEEKSKIVRDICNDMCLVSYAVLRDDEYSLVRKI